MFNFLFRKKAVGLILFTNFGAIPNLGLTALLSVRGRYKSDRNLKSYPGGCQVTAHRGAVSIFRPDNLTLRELVKDLGIRFYNEFFRRLKDNGGFHKITIVEREGIQFITYCVMIDSDLIDLIERSWTSGGFRMVHYDTIDHIKNLLDFNHTIGVTDNRLIAMFPDEAKALKMVFANPQLYF